MVDLQLVAVCVIVGLAVLFLARRSLQTWFGKKGCGGGCGCERTVKQPTDHKNQILIPVEQLTVRKR